MDSERAPTCQRGSGPTEAQGQTGSDPAGVLNRLLAAAGPAAPLTPLIGLLSEVFGSKRMPVPSLVLTLLGVLWIAKSCRQTCSQVLAWAEDNFTYSVTIPQADEIYEHMLEWMSQQGRLIKASSSIAQTVPRSASDDKEYLGSVLGGGEYSSDEYTDFFKRVTSARPRFLPAIGKIRFWYKKTYFAVDRSRYQAMSSPSPLPEEKEEMKISCFGRSREPIERVLVEAKKMYYDGMMNMTKIYWPSVPTSPYVAAHWKLLAKVSKRPLNTVVISKETKDWVLNEITEFLSPKSEERYAARGMPWRQGYLLHGPPGTGKTSFVQALAGHLDLSLYIIDLQHNKLSNKHVMELFRLLPKRSIVLIEDIDVTGIQADGPKGAPRKEGESKPEDTPGNGRKIEKADNRKSMITEDLSFSGVLNSIDGLGSQEGRILIMTTNRPKSLDEALIRSGRVDFHIEIHNATHEQAAELFCQIYQDATPPKPSNEAQSAEKGAKSAEEIKRLSEEFGKKIPDGLCSPAEIQGFLLPRKKDPQRALDDVESWVEASVKQKESGSNVRTMQ